MDRVQEKKALACFLAQNYKNFAKEHEYREHFLWSGESKINLFSSDAVLIVWHEPGQDYHRECIGLTEKHGGESVMIRHYVSADGVGEMMAPWMPVDIVKYWLKR